MITFTCSNCDAPMTAPDALAGADAPCEACGTVNLIPTEIEEEGVDKVTFGDEEREYDDLDMTPMVDVTFLLLIFFMVTAAFSLQKSLEIPAPDREESAQQSRTIEEIEEDDDYIIVRIDKDNTVWVDESEAPSEQEILEKLRDAKEGGGTGEGPTSLLVLADGEADHETVVMCIDAGNGVGMESIRLATVDEDDF